MKPPITARLARLDAIEAAYEALQTARSWADDRDGMERLRSALDGKP